MFSFNLLFIFRSLSRCIEPLLFFNFHTNDNRKLTFEVNRFEKKSFTCLLSKNRSFLFIGPNKKIQ